MAGVIAAIVRMVLIMVVAMVVVMRRRVVGRAVLRGRGGSPLGARRRVRWRG